MGYSASITRRGFFGAATLGALLLSACSGTSSTESVEDSEPSKRKVATVSDGSINDGGWCASCYQAMVDAADKLGWECAYTENVAQADWGTAYQNYIDQGYDLIFVQGEEYQETVKQLSKDNPDARFALLQGTTENDGIESLAPNDEEIGQLAGALAGLLTKTNSVGFIGGVELASTQTKFEAYKAALQTVNPDANATVVYAGSYTDAAKGKEIASTLINQQNVDVIFGDASIVDTGARETLAEYSGRYNIGQPGDIGSSDDKIIACSVVTDNESMLEQAMRDIEDGTFGNKTITGDLSNGGVKIGTFSSVIVPNEIEEKYEAIVEQIENGTFSA
jgi:basic membrane protein A